MSFALALKVSSFEARKCSHLRTTGSVSVESLNQEGIVIVRCEPFFTASLE
ncbi:hypothetical protein CSIRO_3941 [Bradyrhizobiaceae bacterium SG-6C]|nr:hypothetical protein CSIRO_3941 [Bradyrhizobiaceae bacterium SG-6C]